MAKFVIECSNCGRYAEASTGWFLGIGKTKSIDCTCGHTINVATEKITSRVCAQCGNNVIFDQSKGENAVCPVCHNKVNTRESMASLVEFSCPSCSCRLSADKYASEFTCVLCGTEIDVQKQIAKEKAKNMGLASVIKYEGGNDVLVWKHPIEDFNLGSQLIVHESQEAIYFKDGKALDLFGAGRYTLATQNLPLLENLYKLPTNSDEVFHSEVYFVNLVTQMGIKWGTDSKVRLFDPGSGLHIEIGACGNFSLRVIDSRKLLVNVVGTTGVLTNADLAYDRTEPEQDKNSFTIKQYTAMFKSRIMKAVKSNLPRAIRENNLNILEIDEHMDELSEIIRKAINIDLDEFGLTMPEFSITSISTPDDDPNYKRLKEQFAQKTLNVREENIKKEIAEAAQGRKIVEAQTEAQLKMVTAQGEAEALKLKAMAEAEAYKAKAYAEAEEMRAKGYTYQQETARQVGLEAMQNGITGGGDGGSGGIGSIAGLGVTLGAMGGVMNLTREALNPVLDSSAQIGSGIANGIAGNAAAAADTWNCSCGQMNISSKCCPECGAKKPEPVKADTWECPACGTKDIKSKFCPECGAKKPEPPATWVCPACGAKNITSKFCPECGAKKPEPPKTWTCKACGKTDITSKFCPECGAPKESEE